MLLRATLHPYSFKLRSPAILTRRYNSSSTCATPLALASTIRQVIDKAVAKHYPEASQTHPRSPLRRSKEKDVDYESQIPFLVAHKAQAAVKRDVHDVALVLQSELEASGIEAVERVVVSNKDILHFRVSDSYLYAKATDKHFLVNAKTDEKLFSKVLIDYASPNMAKELHVGHLRSTMIGACLKSVFEHKGSQVTGLSHVGDFGSPLGSVIAEITEEGKEKFPMLDYIERGETVPVELLPTPTELTIIYINSKKRAASSEEFREKAMRCTREIQMPSGEENFSKKVWWEVLRASRRGFDEIYEKLGVTVTEKGESSYADGLEAVMTELKEKGILKQSEGAWVVFTTSGTSPLMTDDAGTYLYAATDLVALKQRINSGMELLLYVTDQGQKPHFTQAGQMAGWFEEKNVKTEHIGFGVVTDMSGKKLSSRDGKLPSESFLLASGTPMTLAGLLNDAVTATQKAILATKSLLRSEKKLQQVQKNTTDFQYTTEEKGQFQQEEPSRLEFVKDEFERQSLSNAAHIAYNAIIYFELSNARRTNYKFSFDAMLNMKGNTAMYLIYAYARIRSVLSRAEENNIQLPTLETTEAPKSVVSSETNLTSQERALCLQLLTFPEVIDKILQDFEPNHLCGYLFDLAKIFHHFYETCRVIGSPNQQERLKICLATEIVLFKGLELLNVTALEKV